MFSLPVNEACTAITIGGKRKFDFISEVSAWSEASMLKLSRVTCDLAGPVGEEPARRVQTSVKDRGPVSGCLTMCIYT